MNTLKSTLQTMKLLLILIVFLAIFGDADAKTFQISNTLTSQYFVPCNENYRNCYPGLERCFDHQQCLVKTWLILVSLLIPTLSILIVLGVVYLFLKQRKIWILCLLALFALAVVGLFVGSLVTGLTSEDQEVSFAEEPMSNSADGTSEKFDSSEFANTESHQPLLTFTRNNIGFVTAMGYSAIYVYVTLVTVATASFAVYMCKLNSEKFDSLDQPKE